MLLTILAISIVGFDQGMGKTETFACRSDGLGSLTCTCNESTEDKLIETILMYLLKREVDYPVGLGSFRIEQCPNVLDIKLDFDQLKMTYPGLKKIKFENVASIKAILDGHIQHGDMNIAFQSIRETTSEDRSGYAILAGNVNYCVDPCSKAAVASESEPPWKRRKCKECDPDSHLNIKFDHVDHVLLDGVSLANYGEVWGSRGVKEYGGATLSASNVRTLRAETAYLRNVEDLGTYADLCWRVGKTGSRGATEDREVSCSSLFTADDNSWYWWYWAIGVLIIVGVCACAWACGDACSLWEGCKKSESAVTEADSGEGGPGKRDNAEMKPMNPDAPTNRNEPPPYGVACAS